MLILSRKRDETVYVGDDIQVTVIDIRGDKVRLGFEAPEHVVIHRKEVWLTIQNQQQRESEGSL